MKERMSLIVFSGTNEGYSSLDSKGQARVYRGLSRAGIRSLCSA
jgi:hypothetical protein